ncbi:hypothetical protein P4O66_002306 [Electrophorus voltai]|uniref:Uncharacterized protein n=1 Tax=Electrophorus voltai TaxID=2609070 RepID=A0AAD9DQ64_9TELE|nr:hypothetical protein P4O66_002306 [Electrophorus voltai]
MEDYMDVTDTMGVRLLDRKKMEDMWQTQRRHLHCIQDPLGVQLYRRVGQVTRGGVVLPVYRCARGSTSLESFHLHLNPFIPGTSASALHFQAYLLERLESLGPAAVLGYHHVVNLANSLVDLRHQAFVTQQRVDSIVALWEKLPESDFCFPGQGSGPSSCPSVSRLVGFTWPFRPSLASGTNARKKKQEQDVLCLSVGQSNTPMVAPEPLPPALSKLLERRTDGHPAFDFNIQQDVSGQAFQRVQGQPPLLPGETLTCSGLEGDVASATNATPVLAGPQTTAWQ